MRTARNRRDAICVILLRDGGGRMERAASTYLERPVRWCFRLLVGERLHHAACCTCLLLLLFVWSMKGTVLRFRPEARQRRPKQGNLLCLAMSVLSDEPSLQQTCLSLRRGGSRTDRPRGVRLSRVMAGGWPCGHLAAPRQSQASGPAGAGAWLPRPSLRSSITCRHCRGSLARPRAVVCRFPGCQVTRLAGRLTAAVVLVPRVARPVPLVGGVYGLGGAVCAPDDLALGACRYMRMCLYSLYRPSRLPVRHRTMERVERRGVPRSNYFQDNAVTSRCKSAAGEFACRASEIVGKMTATR